MSIKIVHLTPGALNCGSKIGKTVIINNLTLDRALQMFGGVELNQLMIDAGAEYQPVAVEFLLTRLRVRRPASSPPTD